MLTLALDGGEWLISRSVRYASGEEPPVFIEQEIGVGHRTILDYLENGKSLAPAEIRRLKRLSRSLVAILTTKQQQQQ